MKYYYTYRNKFTQYESKHYRTAGAVKARINALCKYRNGGYVKTDYEIVTYECVEVAVTQLQ